MADLSDNVQSAITAVLQSASIHLDYVGDLQHGYHHHQNANQQLRSMAPETTGIQVVNNTLDNTKQQQNNPSTTASTATGIPDPSAIVSAIDHVEKKEQDADEEPSVASTAIGLPAPEPIINAMKEGGDDLAQNDATTTKENSPLSNTLQNAINPVTSAPSAVIDNLAPSDFQDGPSPNPSKMKHKQQQPEKSCMQQTDPSHDSLVENVKLSADSDQTVQNATANVAVKSGTIDVDASSTTAAAAMKEPTHTIIDNSVKSVDPTPVEPVVENIVAKIQDVEEPVVEEEEIIRDPLATTTMDAGQTMDSPRPTPVDVKAEDLPNVEARAAIAETVVTEDPAGDEIKVEQKVSSPSAADDIKQMASMVVTDTKTEGMPVVEEPATVDDLKTKPMDEDGLLVAGEPIKKDGAMNSNDVNVEQQPMVDDISADDDECLAAKKKEAKDTSDNTATASSDLHHQQPTAPIDGQSRSMESKSSLPQRSSPEQQDRAPAATSTGQSQEQPAPESNAPKSSKCAIM